MHRLMHVGHVVAHDSHHELYPPDSYMDLLYREPPHKSSRLQKGLYFAPGVLFVGGVLFFLGWAAFGVAVGGVLAYAFSQQYVHDAIHIKGHWLERFQWFWRCRTHHWLHHVHDRNFGITTFLFDRVFRSFEPVTPDLSKSLKEEWR